MVSFRAFDASANIFSMQLAILLVDTFHLELLEHAELFVATAKEDLPLRQHLDNLVLIRKGLQEWLFLDADGQLVHGVEDLPRLLLLATLSRLLFQLFKIELIESLVSSSATLVLEIELSLTLFVALADPGRCVIDLLVYLGD